MKILYIKDVEKIINRNRLTLRRWWAKDQFPKPISISGRLAWHVDTINAWIEKETGIKNENDI